MASFNSNAFNNVNAFSVGAFDFGATKPSFSDGAFGKNTAFSDRAFSFVVTPPSPPIPVVSRFPGGVLSGGDEEQLYKLRLRKRFEQQNRDDVEMVRLLTEFLSRIQ